MRRFTAADRRLAPAVRRSGARSRGIDHLGLAGDLGPQLGQRLLGRTELPGDRLQQLPADHPVRLDQRPELPERQPVADELGGGGDGGDADALVDQRDLAEVVARLQVAALLAADGDVASPDSIT